MAEKARRPFNGVAGGSNTTLDPKGRVIVPKDKRDHLGDDFVINLGERGQLVCFPVPVWNKLMDTIEESDPLSLGATDYIREFVGTAEFDNNCDPQGRLVIPKDLRARAKITSEVRIVGRGPVVEIWSLEEFNSYQDSIEDYNVQRKLGILNAKRRMAEGI
ncbi:MAG: hypothetical protein KF812_08310 [Fimbriimonadaceae bacterium]|nr:hypothetical protein [Fimbriimonadaceae bacterium]